jgi:hypothetical protein
MAAVHALFTALITVQFAVVVGHDWVDIPGWTHGRQVREAIGPRTLLLATLINGLFPGLAVAFALSSWGHPQPGYVADYWLLYCAVTVGSAIVMWYLPYLRGTSEEKTRLYARLYEGTRQVLPERGDRPRPNLLHVCFHVLFLTNLSLALLLRLGGR